jgi:hypothetical protein
MKSKSFLLIMAGVFLLCLVQGVCAAETYTYVTSWGSMGSGPGQFMGPRGISVYPDVLVTDSVNNNISIFNDTGFFYRSWGLGGTGNGQFDKPWGIASSNWPDNPNNFYVVDNGNARVQKFGEWSGYNSTIGGPGTGPGLFVSPSGIAVNWSGYIYVTDIDRVEIFDPYGNFVSQLQSNGTANGQFKGAVGVATDWNRNVYVLDRALNRVQKFTPDLQYITQWGTSGSGNSQFSSPEGITVDYPDYNVYVADTGNNRIQKFTTDGTYVTQWGGPGSGPGQFNSPTGIAIDGWGIVSVVDSNNYRVQQFAHPVTLTYAGGGEYYLGEYVNFFGVNTDGTPTYLFMTGPDLPAGGVQLNLDPGNSSVTEGNGGTFSQATVGAASRWQYRWYTTEDMPINVTAETFMTSPHSVFSVYAESQPHDASNVASGNYTSVNINMSMPFISATASVSTLEPGDTISFRGTKEGCASPDCYVSVFIKNDTFGGSLPYNGTKPDDFSVQSVTGVNATFGQATVNSDRTFEYVWDTSAISGGSLLPSSEYQVIVSMRPMNWPDVRDARMRGLPYAGYYTKLAVGIMGPLHPDYAVNITTGMQPLTVAFTDLSGGFDETYMDFGDGTEANLSSTYPNAHTYTSAGTFTPVIYAINSTSTEGRTNATITVTPSVGSIVVTSTPTGASITLDGSPLIPTTPHEELDVPSGYHHVQVALATYISQEKSVYVEGGKNASVNFTLDLAGTTPGYLGVSSNVTGAQIFVDGGDTGHTTPYNITGYVGNHSVKLTYDGYFDAQRNVMIPSDTYVPLYIRMDPYPQGITDPTVLAGIKVGLKEETDDDTSVKIAYSSPNLQPASQKHTLWGVQPTFKSPPKQTTVLFIDKDPGMNWEHASEYVFIDNTGKKTVIPVMSPSLDLPTVQVSGTGYDPEGMDLNAIGSGSTPSKGGGLGVLDLAPACTSPTSDNNYAVLIDGGYDKYNNHIRYWNDISFMYQTLNKTYNVPKDHIRVLMSDGTSTDKDRHNWTYADGTNLTDDSPRYFDGASGQTQVTGGANIDDLTAAFNSIPDGADLFVFTTGHGAKDDSRSGEAMLYLWDQNYIYASEFVNLLPANANSITMVMEQCNSGGFVTPFMQSSRLAGINRAIVTAAAWNQPSKDNGFSSTWTMAAARIDSNMRPALLADSAPGNGDFMINFWEASTYAQNNDPYRSVETAQYRDSPSLIGKSEYLRSCSAAANSLRITSPMAGDTWSIGYSNNITWGQTGLDTTTVAITLWNRSPLVKVQDIATGVSASKRYTLWTPSTASLIAGGDYVIKITSTNPVKTDQNTLNLLAYNTAGKFNVTSVPVQGAYVYVDGLNKSQKTNTLSILGIAPGNHILGVTLSGRKDVELKEYVYANKYTNETFTLLPPTDNFAGTLVVTSSPVTAEIVVDGVPSGLWTSSKVPYNEGTHTVTVKAFGYQTPTPQTIMVSSRRPVVADFTLTRADPHRAVFRSTTTGNNWFFDNNMDGSIDAQDRFGQVGDIPLVGDLNDDGIMDRAVFRSVTKGNNWFIDYSMDGSIDAQNRFGQIGDIPLVGDFNNDGIMDRAVFRGVTKGNNWFFDYSMDGSIDKPDRFGQFGDLPVVWNG